MASLFNAWRKTLKEYKPRRIRGAVWYRAVTPAYRRSILNMDGAFRWGGRYNAPGEFGALYLSKTKKGVIAEITRRPAHPSKYIVGKIQVKLGKVCDLTDPDLLKKLRLTRKQLVADDLAETQALGNLIREAGFEGIIVPSAAGKFNNLVIFVDHLKSTSEVELEEVNPLVLS
jgi:RES domain-containing protein